MGVVGRLRGWTSVASSLGDRQMVLHEINCKLALIVFVHSTECITN